MKKIITVCLMLLIISLIGCAKKEALPTGPTATEANVNEIGNGISDAGALDKDLSTSDLGNISSDLDNINW